MGFLTRLRRKDPQGSVSKQHKFDTVPRSSRDVTDDSQEIVIISGRPRSATEPQVFSLPPIKPVHHGSLSQDRGRRAGAIPAFDEKTTDESKDTSARLHNPLLSGLSRPDTLISSSLAPSPRSGALNVRQRQEESVAQHDDGGRAEELSGSAPDTRPSYDFASECETADSTASRAGRLLRRASGKLLEKRSPRKDRRGESEAEGGVGWSFSNSSSISLASIASTMSTRGLRQQQSEAKNREHPPTSATSSAFRRARALSSASVSHPSAGEVNTIGNARRSNKASHRAGDNAVEGANEVELPLSPPYTGIGLIGAVSPPGQDDGAVSSPASRWKRAAAVKHVRPSTSSGGYPATSSHSYLHRLSPPPRGLAAGDVEGRRALMCDFVHRRSLEEMRLRNKSKTSLSSNLKLPLTPPPSSPTPSSPLSVMDSLLEMLEDDFLRFMEDDIRQGADPHRYEELRLADVFIEARRSLGLEVASTRLHAMYDLNAAQTSQLSDVQVMGSIERDGRTAPSTTSPMRSSIPPPPPPPPSAWDGSQRSGTDSLTPAPRKKRRPKTAPNHARGSAGVCGDAGEVAKVPDALPTHLTSLGGLDGTTDIQSQILTPSLFSSRAAAPSPSLGPPSLPPSPPRSSGSHQSHHEFEKKQPHSALSRPHPRPKSSTQALRWSTESQTLTNSSCDASPLPPTYEIMLAKVVSNSTHDDKGNLYA